MMKMAQQMKTTMSLAVAMGSLTLAAGSANAASVALQQATATGGRAGFEVSQSIDGNVSTTTSGWYNNTNANQIAAYETVTDLGMSALSFNIYERSGFHIDQFRISVTQDDRSTFADGLATGGDVTATWTVLTPLTPSGTINGDGTVDIAIPSPTTDPNTMTALTPFGGITGFRFEMNDGNGLLAEFQIDAVPAPVAAVPEPSSAALLGLGGLALILRRRK